MKNIYLIGLMGSGKTAIGRDLARKIRRRYVDTDVLIEKKMKLTVSEIFQQRGEDFFRQQEIKVLGELAKSRNKVVATGGGVPLRRENVEAMQKSGIVIWLKRDPQLILQGRRIHTRPLLAQNPAKIYEIAKEREAVYAASAHWIVNNNGERRETVAKILNVLKRERQ